ncbi:MAG: 4Fe-4S dicluster domain-containing protein [Thermodesulfobacteriota bacterium]
MDRIDLKKLDPDFKHRVARELGGEHVKRCFSCGVCSARCPIEKIEPEYNPRKIIRMILLGLEKELLKEEFLWHCSTCYTCQESCPQQVNFTEVIFALRNMAVRQGLAPAGMGAARNLLEQQGRLYEVGDFENEKRQELGLPTIIGNPEDYKKLLGL